MNGIQFISGYFNKNTVTDSLHRQFVLYLISGGICFVIDMAILLFLVEFIKINVNIANCISVLTATYAAYLLNVKFVFRNGKFGLKTEISFFYIFSTVGFFLNALLLYMLVDFWNMWYVPAKILITITIALFNFTTRKYFIFSK